MYKPFLNSTWIYSSFQKKAYEEKGSGPSFPEKGLVKIKR